MVNSCPKLKSDYLIIGGGVLGISLAYHLTLKGLKVTIVEKEPLLASHASAKNAGMIRQLYRNEQLSEWTTRSIANWPTELKEKYFKETGSIVVGRKSPEHSKSLFEDRCFQSNQNELPYVYCATDGLLQSEDYVHGLNNLALQSKNLTIFKNSKVTQLTKLASGNWELETAGNQKFECGMLINAAGAWLNSFIGNHPELQIAAKPFVRHLFVSEGWGREELHSDLPNHGFYWDEEAGWYRRNWTTNSQLVSACDTNPANPDDYTPNTEMNFIMADKILSNYPDLGKHLTLGQSWFCFRTYTKDQLPVIGFSQSHSNVYNLCAFGGFGMSTSFAATEDAAKEIS